MEYSSVLIPGFTLRDSRTKLAFFLVDLFLTPDTRNHTGSVKGLLAMYPASLLGRPSLLPVERSGDRSGSIAARANRLLIHLRTEARDKVSNSSLETEAGTLLPELIACSYTCGEQLVTRLVTAAWRQRWGPLSWSLPPAHTPADSSS